MISVGEATGKDGEDEDGTNGGLCPCNGYNVCLFSYGQTGSGKTHTMQGSDDGPMRGIIPRAIAQVNIDNVHISTTSLNS